jgi:hypothetical protein
MNTIPWETFTLWAVVSSIASFLGGAVGAYLKKKAENLATKEDLKDIVTQMSAITDATKKIEAEISGDLWDRQKRWELKRDLMLEITSRVADFKRTLISISSFLTVDQDENSVGFQAAYGERLQSLLKASYEYDATSSRVTLVCDITTGKCLEEFHKISNAISIKMGERDTAAYPLMRRELFQKSNALLLSIRRELGIPFEPITNPQPPASAGRR